MSTFTLKSVRDVFSLTNGSKGRSLMLMVLLLLVMVVAKANPVDVQEARRVGANFVSASTTMRATASDMEHVITYNANFGVPAFYVFNTSSGFVIVSADDCAIPILGYSEEGQFDPNNIPVQMEEYLQGFVEQIRYGITYHLTADPNTARQWQEVRSSGRIARSRSSAGPLLTDIWNQSCYYNNLCPEDSQGPCGHVYAGCVATAMSQIMHYWGYPTMGTGSHSYTPEGYPTQSVNFGATTYDWNNMPDELTSSSSSTQINAIATLMWHCGVAVDMMYGNNGSGAYSYDVSSALPTYFGYSSDLSVAWRDDYTDEAWLSMVKSCLDLGRPIHYSGQDTGGGGGHAFVCDGYDNNDQLHFNWGWSGYGNGFFAVDALNAPGYQFNNSNMAILNIVPGCNGETYQVTASCNPSTGGTVSGAGYYSCGNGCTVSATPATGYMFCSWTENGTVISTEPTYSFTVTENRNLVANFFESTSEECTLVFTLNDSYGDGWTGNALTVSYSTGCVGYEEITFDSGTTATVTRNVPTGSHVVLGWIPGSWMEECSFTLNYESGEVICSASNLSANYSYEFDVNCSGTPPGPGGNPVYVPTYPTNRNVILEEFTGRNCGYCPDGHRIANEIMQANPGRVWAINVHAGGYAPTSYPNLNTTDGTTILGGFNVSGFPSGVVNRSTADAQSRSVWTSLTNTQLSQVAECNVGGQVSIDPVSRTAAITVEVYYTSNSAYNQNYLTVAMLQDSILGSQSDYGNYNPTQWVGDQYCHMHVLRDMITPAWGEAINPTTQGTLITRTYTYQIPETIGSPNGVGVDLSNITFLAWVSETYQGTPTRPILTACKLTNASEPYTYYNITATANPSAGGTITGTGNYVEGSTCTLQAMANENYSFVNWTKNGVVVSTNATYTFNVTESATYVANFEEESGDYIYIGDGGTMTNTYLPTYEFYCYSLTQQIYTADEIGTAGTINSIAFFTNSSATRTLQVYLVHTDMTAFNSTTDWITPSTANMVYSGEVTYVANGWTTINFDTPFSYNGTSNLALIVDDNTGSYVSSVPCRVFNANGNQAIRIYSDGTNYDPFAPGSYNGTLLTVKNQLRMDIDESSPIGGSVVVEIGDGTSTTYMVPFNSLYGYSFTEQVFFADEIGTAGNITSISFNLGQSYTDEQTNEITLYMKNVTRETFSANTDYEPVTQGDIVYSGLWTIPANTTGWITIDLDTPFAYDGTSNLMVAMLESTSGYSTRYFVYTSVSNSGLSYYSDSYLPDPYNLDAYSGSKVIRSNRNNIQLAISTGGSVVTGDLTVHDGTTTNGYVPVYGFYADAYLKAEMVYPAAELSEMTGGNINNMKFYATQSSVSWGNANFQVFMKEVTDIAIQTYYGMDGATMVYEGSLNIVDGEMNVEFTTPYQYNGGNLLIGFYNTVQGSYVTSTWYGETVNNASVQGYNYSGLSSITPTQRNFLPKTTFNYTIQIQNELAFVVTPDPIVMGYRPNGAWMRPFTVNVLNDGMAVTMNEVVANNAFFQVEAVDFEMPGELTHGRSFNVNLTTGTTEAGEINANLILAYDDNGTTQYELTATAYDPVSPDVWELAELVTTFPFTDTLVVADIPLYDNYVMPLPAIADGADAVYQLVFTEDTYLNASVTSGENGKVALYPEGFKGLGGPDMDNYYAGPQIGNVSLPFEAQIGEGTSTTGYFPFYTLYNYSIAECLFLADELAEAGVTSTPMTSLSWYATNAPGYLQQGITIWMANVDDETLTSASHVVTNMTMVYMGAITPEIGWNEFVFNVGDFSWDGNSNVLIYCQRNNGEWNSTVQWQATSGMPFTCMSYRYQDTGAYDPTISNSMYTSTTRPNIIMKGGNREGGNRATVPVTFNMTDSWGDGWNGGYIDVVENGVSVAQVTLPSGSSGSEIVELNEGAHVTLIWNAGLFDSEVFFTVELLGETIYSVSSPSAGYLYEFDIFGGGGYNLDGTITNMTVTPGTYYLVASSTSDEFVVEMDATEVPCPEIAYNPYPADGATEVNTPAVHLRWFLGDKTTEYRIMYGTTYYCEDTLIDWTRELSNNCWMTGLFNNTNYFWRIDQRNDGCPDGVRGEVWGFTTHLNVPPYLYAGNHYLQEGSYAYLYWGTPAERGLLSYNIYQDDVFIGNTSQDYFYIYDLPYNMNGYRFNVTAVYDEGESGYSSPCYIYVSGNGFVEGHVYEQDGVTPIANAFISLSGTDEFGYNSYFFFNTDDNGYFYGVLKAGSYSATAICSGYQDKTYTGTVSVVYSSTTSDIDFVMDEKFYPVTEVVAQYFPDSLDLDSPFVKVYWGMNPVDSSIEDFETGDFSKYDWQNDANYPWEISVNNPYDGSFCMKSGGAGVANMVSDIMVTMDIPTDGMMSFYGKISSESNYDYGRFYIDGVEKGSWSGAGNWTESTYEITAGTHTFQWRYAKDGSVNSNDDCFYVDHITFYREPDPVQPGTTYDFEDSTLQGWTTIDADGDGYGWRLASEVMSGQPGNNGSSDFVLSQSYYNGVVLYPDNYLVSPQVALGGIVRFYACAQDASYAAEHFGVAVSTTNTNPSSFTMLQEWTMTAKKAEGKPVDNSASDVNIKGASRDGNTRAQGNWYQYTVDMSAYAGQTGYVAIRHFNCSDMFYLNVDDIFIGDPTRANPARSFQYYRLYRTDAYNFGPYNAENTVLLADQLTDTVFIDVDWQNLETGVYKYGVSCVYEGNRESSINWGASNFGNDSGLRYNPELNEYETSGTTQKPTCGSRDAWDLLYSYSSSSGYQYGVASDGINIYQSSWSSSAGFMFAKYDMQGNFIETFDVEGCGYCRDLTYDGQYFYGVANSSTIYCIDLANHTLINTIDSAYGAMRCCSYDPVRDGFWVVGNWSGDLTLVDRTGAIQITGPAPESASGVAYFMDANNVEHVYCFNNGNNQVYDYDIASNTIASDPVFDFNNTPGCTGTSGGCFVGDYNGTMAFYGVIQQSPNLVGIYALNSNPAVPGLQVDRESVIKWSNLMDKNMLIGQDEVTISVLLNSADSPEGTVVSFVNQNEYEQQYYPIADVTLDATGYFAWESFRRGTYQVTVQHNGYETIIDNVSIMEPTDLSYVMTEIIYNASDLYVSSTGWAMWNPNGTPAGTGDGDAFFVDLDEGLPGDWTVIDADGDGYTWVSSMEPGVYHNSSVNLEGTGHDGSAHYVISASYANGLGQALSPDNYFVSPQVNLVVGSSFSFWACAQDTGYPAEHFGVAISDNGLDNWTMVNEWTMTAKGSGMKSIGRNGVTRDQGNWYYYSVDLSAYTGQKYIAIRHFNCYDQFILNVDDVELTAGAKSGDRHLESFTVECTTLDGVLLFTTNTEQAFCQIPTDELVSGEHYIVKVAANYTTGLSDWNQVEWQYISCDNYDGTVNGVTIDGNEISWEYPVIQGGDSFTESWDDGLNGWTNIDNDGDGHMWYHSTEVGNHSTLAITSHSGEGHLMDESYCNATWNALMPDDYIVSPQQYAIGVGSTISLWACTQDVNYPSEHFGFAISMGSNTNASDFTTIAEWTITSKGAGNGIIGRAGRSSREGAWYQFSADLSDYAGQNVWIAVRHFNCTDQFILNIDDIELTNGGRSGNLRYGILGTMIFADGEVVDFVEYPTNTYVYEGNAREVSVRLVYNGTSNLPEGNIYYSMSCPESIGGNTQVTQTTDFAEGWNWWSTYIDQTGIDGLTMLEEGLGDNGSTIKSQGDGFVQYMTYGGYNFWYGTLDHITNTQTYMVQTNAAVQVEMNGTAASPANSPITISEGWNWIGFPSANAMDFATAFSGITPMDGDIVKSQNSFAQYMVYGNYSFWYGELSSGVITPGMGLMYKSVNGESYTLTYPVVGRNDVVAEIPVEKHWTNNVHLYPANMTVLAVVELNDIELRSDSYELAAFANGEVRGSARLTYVEPLNRYMAFLTVSGNEAAELHFALYNAETGEENYTSSDKLVYETDAAVGSYDEPMVVSFRSTTGLDDIERDLQVYPNPVKRGERFSFNLPVGSEVRVDVVNALGAIISTETSTKAPASFVAPSTAGIYTIRITVEGKETYCRKLIVR